MVTAAKPTRNWWDAREGEVYRTAIPYVRTVENYQAELFDKFVKLAALYDVNPRTNRHIQSDNVQRLGRARAVITENLIATNIDTVAANVADQDIRIRVLTDYADWSHQRMAKSLECYGDGLSELFDVGPKCRVGFKAGAATKGTGINKVFIDEFDQIQVKPVPIDNIVVDEAECRDGYPRQLHYRDFFNREDLKAQFPEYEEKIAAAQTSGNWRLWAGYRPMANDEILVIESWRLPVGPRDHKNYRPGRHTVCIDGCDLIDEEYHKPRFPFSKMVWNAPIWGFYGISLAERIMPHQNLMNRRNYQINTSLDRKVSPVTWVHQSDANITTRSIAQIGAVATYRGSHPPISVDYQAVGQETYASRREIKQDAAAEAGTSQAMQGGGVPAGIESGVGVREVRTTRTQRFSIQEKAFEQFWLDTVWLILDCCKDLGDKAPKILHVTDYGAKTIRWKDVDMGDLKIQLAAASTLGDSEAGRQQRVVELAQAGVITLDESRDLMEHPDIGSVLSLYNASYEAVKNKLERILDGERLLPTPYDNLDCCVKMGMSQYDKLDIGKKYGGAPEEILEALGDFISAAAAMLNPPQVPGDPNAQPGMATPGMPPPQPGASGPAQAAFAPGAYGAMTA
jgi:hypothetical protein